MVSLDKKKVDIEKLLQWAFLDELPKRLLNATGESGDRWHRRIEQYGSLGGVDIDESVNFQTYAYVGEPHRDADRIEKAVAALGPATVDWESDFELIAGDLAALVSINGVTGLARRRKGKSAGSAFYAGGPKIDDYRLHPGVATGERLLFAGMLATTDDGRGIRAQPLHGPRDVIAVNTINLSALVHMHAIKRSRPDWKSEPPACYGVPAARGKEFAIVGECRGKNLYTPGSYCPLRWSPSPVATIMARADYLLWHRALRTLADTLLLSEHAPLLPEAPAAPWLEGEIVRRSFKQTSGIKEFFPRAVTRPRAGALAKKPKNSKVRFPRLDKGA